jgi:hypothetical protein
VTNKLFLEIFEFEVFWLVLEIHFNLSMGQAFVDVSDGIGSLLQVLSVLLIDPAIKSLMERSQRKK